MTRAATMTPRLTCSSMTTAAEMRRAGVPLLAPGSPAVLVCPRSLTRSRSHRDEEELARERERKVKLTDKQMDEVLKMVPKVPPKPRQRGHFNSAM